MDSLEPRRRFFTRKIFLFLVASALLLGLQILGADVSVLTVLAGAVAAIGTGATVGQTVEDRERIKRGMDDR